MSIFGGSQSFIPERFEHLLYKYGEIANVYVAAYDGEGESIIDFACDETEREKIGQIFLAEDKKELIHRVTESGLEDQVVEDSSYPGIKIAASAIKRKGKTEMVWVFLGQIKEETDGEEGTEEESAQKIVLERQTVLVLYRLLFRLRCCMYYRNW